MTVSSRTPEGEPHVCSVCGAVIVTEPAEPLGNSVCPRCGALLVRVRDALQAKIGLALGELDPGISFSKDLGLDSLERLELVMQLEEEFDIGISAEEAEQIQTVGDAIRFLLDRMRRRHDEP